MRLPVFAALLPSMVLAGPSVIARTAHPASVRTVELITIGAATADDVPTRPVARTTATLRVHDLDRRRVEYRMAQELAAVTTDTYPAVVATAMPSRQIASFSPIQVPAWMRRVAMVSTTPFVAGCDVAPYRSSGFLRSSAEARRATYYALMSSVACEHGIPVGLFDAMILHESGYDPTALSSKHAFGFAQLMPATAFAMGVDRYDPIANLRGGARYLRQQLDRFGRVELALAAYNAGPARVRSGMIPAIAETRSYVAGVIADWQRLGTDPSPQAQVVASR